MKTWNELSQSEQDKALDKVFVQELTFAVECFGKFYLDEIKIAIQRACIKAERAQTPWFAGEIVRDEPVGATENDTRTVGDILRVSARDIAMRALYSEPGELVIGGIVQ